MADMSLQSGINTFLKQVKEKYQAIDVLVNNVGVFKPGKLMEEPEDQLEILLQTNVISMHKTTRGVLPLLKQSDKAHIFNICSIASKAVLPNSASYCASKAAMYMYSQSLKVELRPFKIRVTSVLPGATYTDSWLGSGVGAERMMDVADIAQMVISAYNLPLRSNIDEIEMRPIGGDI
jgi:short-subunit dehydrogenase